MAAIQQVLLGVAAPHVYGPAPVVESRATTSKTFVNNFPTEESYAVTMPSGITAGDLLLVVHMGGGTSGGSASAGWSTIYDAVAGTIRLVVFAKIATGGDTCAITTGGWASATAWRISGCDSTAKVYATSDTSTTSSTSADPPSLSPAFGVADYLIIALASWSTVASVTGYPSGYASTQTYDAGGTNGEKSWASGEKTVTGVSSEDPGAFTLSASSNIQPATIMIRG